MLKAINSSNEKVISWLPFNKEDKFKCPECNDEVIFVDATFKIKHFRHKVSSNCEPEPETERHLEMKRYMLEKLGWDSSCLEVGLGFARPDLFKDGIAVEVQHSNITYELFLERTSNYTKNNIYVLWIFDDCLVNPELVSEVIKKAHELYFGRIYIFSKINNINGEIVPIHLEPQKSYVKPYTDYSDYWDNVYNGYYDEDEKEEYGKEYGGYYKTLKKRKTKIYGKEITNFNLLKTKNTWKTNNYLIARFYDKNFWKNDKN